VTDYFWPKHLVPNSSSWSLVANTGAFTSPLTGATRTIGRGGDRWACTMNFEALNTDKRALLMAFLAQLRGQSNRVYVVDHAYRRRGNYDSVNLIPDFQSAAAWTTSYSTLTVTDQVGRITAASHTGAQIPDIRFTGITIANGAAYTLRAHFTRSSTGTASMGPFISVGNTNTSYSTSGGLKTAFATSNTTSGTAYLVGDSTGTSMATGDFCDVQYVSMARCMLVNGSSQVGHILNVAGAGAGTGTLLAGDRIEYGGEFNMVADTVDAGSGVTTIRMVRPIRTSPTTATPVVVHDPVCKMMLSDNTVSWSNRPGGISSMTVSLVEDIV
jgi:hypothetical protein